jgi:hypothetical protein
MNNPGSSRPNFIDAGVPADEIEITPEMIEAGEAVLRLAITPRHLCSQGDVRNGTWPSIVLCFELGFREMTDYRGGRNVILSSSLLASPGTLSTAH